ncbi:hypothetical protein GR255_27415, partial [Mycobacterium tuberculosis]|nr:hypothetical protein [Mycobacterium tuberculosis]
SSHTYGKLIVPVVDGYYSDKAEAGSKVVTPDQPPIVNDVTKPTKQTVTFEGAGEDTPTTNVQDSFTFTGKHNPTTNTTSWNESSHTYGKLIVPVVDGYYSDKAEAGSKVVTPDQP